MGSDCTAKIWSVETGRDVGFLREGYPGHDAMILSATFSPDSKHALTASEDRTAKIWDSESGECILTFAGHERPVTSAAYSPDGRFFLTSSRDETAKLWDVHSCQCVAT